ncbi:Long-chain fatty acid transport protein 4, partial [Orchesella cincta]
LLYVLYYKILFQWIKRKRRNETIAKSLDNIVGEGEGDRVCFYFGEEMDLQIQALSFRVANHFQRIGLQKGDSVGLAMTNRPEIVAIWLGLGRLGVVTALINTNLRGDSLEKCVSVVKCKAFIIGKEQKSEDPTWKPKTQNFTDLFPTIDLAACLLKAGSQPTSLAKDQQPNYLDPLVYVFTSGTTGVPKAVACSHGRLCFLASTASVVNLTPKDVVYSALPMYHVGGFFAPVWAFVFRSPIVLVAKFSGNNFWKHVHKYKVTVSGYIGEYCRFLYNQPHSELEKGHKLRAFFGGGVNLEGKVGACGYIPIWFQPIHPIQLVKVDQRTGEIVRDEKTGFAIQCKDGEPGELIGKIVDSVPMTRFDGYTDKEASERKIARDVFKQGDKYFRSGDCLCRDKYGYYYFTDRMGDSFRWNGENVATTMVEAVISKALGMRDNTVYGVKIPGIEGSACMAAILDTVGEFDVQSLAERMKQSLPKYAMPMFIRLINNNKGLDMTGHSNSKKFRLRDDGFNVEYIEDTVFIYSTAKESYSKMNIEKCKEVMRGNYRF